MFCHTKEARAMIMTQEQAFLKAQTDLQTLVAFVRQAAEEEQRIDQVERHLLARLLRLGLVLLEGFVAEHGDGDQGEAVAGADGSRLRRLPEAHVRRYQSIFGELSIRRYVYGSREGQKIESVPLDAALGLPAGDFSYVVEDWAQRLCVHESFAEAVATLNHLLGLRPSVRSLEAMNRALAESAPALTDAQPPPPAREEEPLLVVTADGKGVPMRKPRPAGPRRSPRRGKGEKANQKQMATVGAVYTIAPYVRTADDVVEELQRTARARERPAPCHKEVWAEMTCVVDDEVCNGRVTLFDRLADRAARRNPDGRKPVICLLDGERALWEARAEYFPDSVGILDLFHVLEKLWTAAHCFHAEGSRAAADFVNERLRMLLEGKVGYVIGGLRQMRTKRGLSGAKRKTLQTVITYYENNRAHMKYDAYLAAGYPIGSGVAEGACRHLVKDRLERTGMRWTVEGAQAMLYLRALYLNGDWETFLEYRIAREQKELYALPAA